MTRMTPDQFPMLMQAVEAPSSRVKSDNIRWAISVLSDAVDAGSIRKGYYDEAKSYLGRGIDVLWTEIKRTGPLYEQMSWEERDLYYDCSLISSLRNIQTAHKRLTKHPQINQPVFEKMRIAASELLPLAAAAEALKDKLVKGRTPSANSGKSIAPSTVVKTCPCCFRQIAVQRGTMAHHGYQRPGSGFQTKSCDGVRFPPLESSNAGLLWITSVVRQMLQDTENAYSGRDQKTSVMVRLGAHKFEEVVKGSPRWDRAFRRWVDSLVSQKQALADDLGKLEKMLEVWKPEA